MEFLSFGERCISPIISVFQENPLSKRIGNFLRESFIEWWESNKV